LLEARRQVGILFKEERVAGRFAECSCRAGKASGLPRGAGLVLGHAEAIARGRAEMPLAELSRQNQAFQIVRYSADRIAALQHEDAKIVKVHRDAERIADAPAEGESLLTQRLSPRQLTPPVVRPSQIAKDDADLPVVTNRTGNRQCLLLVGNCPVMVALVVSSPSAMWRLKR
jgi:hypothetical protein